MRRRMTFLGPGLAACALWIFGFPLLTGVANAQTSTDAPAQKTSKPKKSKKTKAQKASSDTAAPGEVSSKPKKSKKSAQEVPSNTFAPTGSSPSAARESAPVRNASSSEIQSAKSSGKVWVNTDSGIYHKSGRWFGATKQGKFMTEDEAVRAGYKPAKNEK
ncbi:MAG TPA: hypothetical protein VH639_11885 [Bryobacteraceae bacterium]